MQTCLLLLGILLAGQLSNSNGQRYGEVPQAPPISNAAEVATPPVSQPPRQDPPAATSTAIGTSPAAPARLAKVIKPAELLRTLVKPTGTEKLAGVPLSLAEAVQNANSRAEQTRLVKLYWELSQAVAEFQLISLETVQLQSIYSGLGLAQPSQTWQQAQQTLTTRSQVARSAARVAQLCLQKEMGSSGENNLPLPSDLPHCGAYKTRFEEIFAGRTSGEAEQLSQLLPLRHQELGQRTLDTMAAREWYKRESQQRNPQSDGSRLLKAYENLALQRRAFVSTAYQYNDNIARYTELAVPQDVGVVRLVAMLIQSDGTNSGNWQRGGIQRATAEQALPANGSARSRRRTFAEEGRSRALRVPAEQDGTERSILVSPKK